MQLGSLVTRFATVAVALAACSACTVGPDYVRPSAPLSDTFRQAPEGWKTAQPADTQPRGDWWTAFGDPGLDALIDQLNTRNFSLAVAEANYRQEEAISRQVRSALYPTVGVNGNSLRSSAGRATPRNVTAAQISANWELDLWGRVRRSVEAGNATAEASAADLAATRLSLQAELATDWFALRIADQEIALYDESIRAYERSLEVTRNRYTSGIVTRADVAQAETQVLSTRTQLIDAGIQRAQLESAIAILVGRPPSELSVDKSDFVPAPPAVPPAVPATLLERRPDVAAAERRAAAANAQIGVAEAAYYPTISLSANGGYQGTSNLFSAANRVWSLGPAAALTLFDAGARRAVSDSAIAAYDANVANYREVVLDALKEVEDNLVAVRLLEQETTVQADAVRAAQESLALTTNQYKAGTVSFLDVVTAQTVELSNRRAQLDIANRRYTAVITLIRALGGTY